MLVIREKEKNILAVLSVIIVVACFMLIYKPTSDEAAKLSEELKIVKSELSKPEISKEELEAFKKSLDAIKLEISSLKNQLPNSEDRGFLIRDLEELAKKNGIELIDFVPKEAIPVTITGQELNKRISKRSNKKQQQLQEQKAKVLKTVININSQGRFDQYINFFRDLIAYYRAVDISDISMTRSSVAKTLGSDKRFSKGTTQRGADPLEQARNTSLNVSFTINAYTSLEGSSEG